VVAYSMLRNRRETECNPLQWPFPGWQFDFARELKRPALMWTLMGLKDSDGFFGDLAFVDIGQLRSVGHLNYCPKGTTE
jgi:hypothetical protein